MNPVTATWNTYKANTQSLDSVDRWNLILSRLFFGTLFASLLITAFISVSAGETGYVLMVGALLFTGLPYIVRRGYQKGLRQRGKQFASGFALGSDSALKKEYRNAAIGGAILLVACWLPCALVEGLNGFSLACVAGFSAFTAAWFLIRGFNVGWSRVQPITGSEPLYVSKPGLINAPVFWLVFYAVFSLISLVSIVGSPERAAAADAMSRAANAQANAALFQGIDTPADQ